MSNIQTVNIHRVQNNASTIHEKCGLGIDKILHTSAFKKTFDNITAVMIAFENFENLSVSEAKVDGTPHSSSVNIQNNNYYRTRTK